MPWQDGQPPGADMRGEHLFENCDRNARLVGQTGDPAATGIQIRNRGALPW